MLEVDWAGETFGLHGERALYRPRTRDLIVADLHLGKAATFRRAGIPVPGGTTRRTLDRLAALVAETRARRLVVLGDFFHAASGRADVVEAISRWRDDHPDLRITLVRGNHDMHAGDPPAALAIDCRDEPVIEPPFELRHVPAAPLDAAHSALAGHVHPVVRLRDIDGTGLRCPCFVLGERSALLPAFGAFTGGHAIRPREGDRVFAVGDGRVAPVRTGAPA